MDTAIKITQLPWTTVLTLASGYAGYFIAHLGAREHHKTADITFGTLIFGFWGLFVYLFAINYILAGSLLASLLAMVVTVVLGGLWSVWGRDWLGCLLRLTGVSHSDDLPTAWSSLGRQVGITASQITVKSTDGVIYHCDDLIRFKDEPNGPCVLGGNGDVLLYATHVKFPCDDDFTEMEDVCSVVYGSEMTFLPRERIERLEIRRQWKPKSALLRRLRRC